MFGDLNSLNSLDKVIKFSKYTKNNKFKLIYCPPYTLLSSFSKKLKNSNIDIGGQNCHHNYDNGPYTGCINARMLKNVGAKYVIIGHSENRSYGETDSLINQKIKSSIKNRLNVIFCIGETSKEKKNKLTHRVIKRQILKGLKGIKKINNILVSYEPVWSIGTGVVPKNDNLFKDINFIKNNLKIKFKVNNPKVLYGGSVNPGNVKNLKEINVIDGFLVGGASQDSKKFIDIVKKTFI